MLCRSVSLNPPCVNSVSEHVTILLYYTYMHLLSLLRLQEKLKRKEHTGICVNDPWSFLKIRIMISSLFFCWYIHIYHCWSIRLSWDIVFHILLVALVIFSSSVLFYIFVRNKWKKCLYLPVGHPKNLFLNY